MVETKTQFNKRLKTLGRKHAKMSGGYTTKIDRNGLIVAKPRRSRGRLPLKGLVFLAGGFLVFKAFMLAAVGPLTYNERLAKLEGGTMIEQAGAKVLGIDPVTSALADFTGPIIR